MKSGDNKIDQLPNWLWKDVFVCAALFFSSSFILYATLFIASKLKIASLNLGLFSSLAIYFLAPVLGWYFFYFRYRLSLKALWGKINFFFLIPAIIANLTISLFFLVQSSLAEIILFKAFAEIYNYQATIDWHKVLAILKMVIAVPILEEFIFRGIILLFLAKKFGRISGLLVSSVIFACFHLNFYSSLATAIISGLILLKTKSLVNSALVHFSSNLLAESIQFFPNLLYQIGLKYGLFIPLVSFLGQNPLEYFYKLIFR